MAGYFIDPGIGTGDGSSDLSPAGSLPGTLSAGTNYLIKAGTTLQRSAAISIASKDGIVFDTWYGAGQASIVASAPNISLFSTSGTTATLTLNNLSLTSLGGANVMSFNSPLTSLILSAIESILPGASTNNHVNFISGQSISGVDISNLTVENGNRALSLLCSTASLTYDNWTIDGLIASGLLDRIIRLTTESTNNAWLSSVFNNLTIQNVDCDRNYGGIWIRSGYDANYHNPPVQGDNILLEDIRLTNSAEFSDNTLPGGISLIGCKNSTVRRVTGINLTTTGAIIGSSSNDNMIYEENYCEHAVSVNGIDGGGLFCDRGTKNSTFRYNTVVDCPGYDTDGTVLAVTNAGGGVCIWDATNNKIYGHVIKDSRYGFSYGHANETGNQIFNNTDIGCTDASLMKLGTSALTGNITQQNNVSIGSATLLSYSGTSYCTQSGNQLFANAYVAGVRLDGNGIPSGIISGSGCVSAGTDLTAYYEDKNGIAFFSPPDIGAFSMPRGSVNGFGIFW